MRDDKVSLFFIGNADGYGKICGGYGKICGGYGEMTEKEGE